MYIGLEKENLIFDENFNPHSFSIDELPANVTLDYSDNQIEFVSDIHESSISLINQMYEMMDNDVFLNKYIWPMSNPGIDNYSPQFEGFTDEDDKKYRKYLQSRYDKNLLNMSGIHFNFSFQENLGEEFYFDLLKKIYIFGPILLQFVAYTPVFEQGMYDNELDDIFKNRGFKHSISLKNSQKYGYYNESSLNLDYSNYTAFKASIEANIDNKVIASLKEIYSKVRLKNYNDKFYLELRFIDINPFNRLGISLDTIDFIMIFLNHLREVEIKHFDINLCLENFDLVALNGYDRNITLNINDQVDSLYNHTLALLKKMCDCTSSRECVINSFEDKYINQTSDLDRLMQLIKTNTIYEIGQQLAYKKETYIHDTKFKGLELSTKILINEALNNDYEVNIIDKEANAIEIKKGDKKEIIFQATKTSADNYANVLVMENKAITKYVLDKENIHTPKWCVMTELKNLNDQYFYDKKIVVKPIDTNFGLGISIFDYDEAKFNKALKIAFGYANKVIIEEFFAGTEYRFLVIDDEVVSIVKRTAANIVGDGIHNIEQLVAKKNCNPLRGVGYQKPLEKIKITDFEIDFLSQQNLDIHYIPALNEVIYLRENSNVSTGGDSAEVFDLIPSRFKLKAQKAAVALGVKICGVDMIIDDQFTNYTIIEANFNPAIQMHTYPLNGFGKNIAKNILSLLDKD